MLRMLLTVAFASCLAVPLHAGQYNRALSIGDAAPDWQELPGVDGEKHSFEDLAQHEVVVVAFTCNSCPYAVDVEPRLVELAKEYESQSVALVAVNVNRVEADRLPAMKERAKEAGFDFPYLFDESQEIARRYGATSTPEFFVLNRQREVVYMGALDDSPDGTDVQTRYVASAIEAALDGREPETTETVPIGCRIRYERERRGRRPRR